MPSVVANIKIKADKIEEAKTFLVQLAKETLESEEGTLVYTVHQRQDDAATFVFYEKYSDDEAFKLHGKNLASKGAEFGPLLDGPPEIIMLEEV
ncbi:MAG: antibiotic biosynthesis monooxygenase [Myxococcota bacterium]